MQPSRDDLSIESKLVTVGRPARVPGAPIGPGVEFTSTYIAGAEVDYARVSNATWRDLEAALGALEGGRALAFASGMAAISAALSLVPSGGTVVVPQHAYNGAGGLLARLEDRGALRVHRVDVTDQRALSDALGHCDLAYLESPTNPMLEVVDLADAFARAHAAGAVTVCDNTFATPLLQQPIQHGADVVVHSATKYLSGHSDLLLGATVTADEEMCEALATHRTLHGGIPGPMEAWLALRGLRTLHLRMARACESARILAERLATHPALERVRYPGTGAIIAVEPRGGRAAAEALEDGVRLWLPATSLGGVESMLERRRRHPLEPATVPDHLVRLSVGVEDVEDLWRDLDRALQAAVAG